MGTVEDALGNQRFRVQLETGQVVVAHLAGKIRVRRIRVVAGDVVRVALSPYDLEHGRIIYREREVVPR